MNAKKNRIYIMAGLVLILIAAVWMIIKAANMTGGRFVCHFFSW